MSVFETYEEGLYGFSKAEIREATEVAKRIHDAEARAERAEKAWLREKGNRLPEGTVVVTPDGTVAEIGTSGKVRPGSVRKSSASGSWDELLGRVQREASPTAVKKSTGRSGWSDVVKATMRTQSGAGGRVVLE